MNRHQKTAKRCLKKQATLCDTTPIYKCDYCDNSYYRSDYLIRHKQKCIAKQEQPTIEETKSCANDNLQDVTEAVKFVEMVKNMTPHDKALIDKILEYTNNNSSRKDKENKIDNLQPITDKDLAAFLDNLSLDFITRGVKGYADYAGNYPFKGKIIYTDRSRKKLKYKNEDGSVTIDGKALAQRFFQAIEKKNTAIINKEYSELHSRLQTIIADNSAGDEDVSLILKRASFIQEMLIKTQNAAQGKDDDFTQSFLSHLSKII